MKDRQAIITDGIRYSFAYAPFDFGQKRYYKCGNKARVRTHRHSILGETYDVCCSNPDCGVVSSRRYAYRHNAVDAWNRKPTITDKFYDICLSRLIDKLVGD